MTGPRLICGAAAFVVAMGCTIRIDWPDHIVRVAVVGADADLRTVNRLGFEVDVTQLSLVVSSVELMPCPTGEQRALPGFAELLVPSAHAHGISTSTKSAVPTVLTGLSSELQRLAEFTPLSGSFCAVVLEVGPSDADAEGLRDPTMVGSSLNAAGRYRGASEEAWTAFKWSTESRATMTFPLEPPLELGDRGVEAQLELRLNAVAWLEDVDCAVGPADAAHALLTGAVSSVEFVR